MGEAMAIMPDAAETFWQRFLATYRFSPKIRPRELVGLILGRNPRCLAPGSYARRRSFMPARRLSGEWAPATVATMPPKAWRGRAGRWSGS
jgi:hypothetical protein